MHAFHLACMVLAVYLFFAALIRSLRWWRWASMGALNAFYEQPSGAIIRWFLFLICIIGAQA